MQTFLGVVPADLLKRTGLGEVFTDALMPCLSYLPTLTPEEESIELLGAVYPALLALVRTRFIEAGEEVGKGSTGQGDVASSLGEMKLGFQRIGEKGKIEREGMGSMPRARLSALDKILRVGVLKGMQYAGEFVRIATLLVEKAGDIVEQMGVWAVKHLKVFYSPILPPRGNISFTTIAKATFHLGPHTPDHEHPVRTLRSSSSSSTARCGRHNGCYHPQLSSKDRILPWRSAEGTCSVLVHD